MTMAISLAEFGLEAIKCGGKTKELRERLEREDPDLLRDLKAMSQGVEVVNLLFGSNNLVTPFLMIITFCEARFGRSITCPTPSPSHSCASAEPSYSTSAS